MRPLLPIKESSFSDWDPKYELPNYEDGCVDLVMTAPPGYTLDGTERFYEDTSYKWDSFEDYMDYMESVFSEVYRMLKNYRYCAVVVGDQTTFVSRDSGYLYDKKFPLAAYFTIMLEKIGFTYITDCIWDKGLYSQPYRGKSIHYPMTEMPGSCYEHILIFQKRAERKEPMPCPYCGKTEFMHRRGFTKAGEQLWLCKNESCPGKNGDGKMLTFTESGVAAGSKKKIENIIPRELLEKWHRNIVSIEPAVSGFENMKKRQRDLPPEIAEMVIRYFSGEGDFVLDPFSGIGTTIFVAAIIGRNYLCFEKDKNDRQRFSDAVHDLDPELKEKLGNIYFGYDIEKRLMEI